MSKQIRALMRGLQVIESMNQSDFPMSLNEIHKVTKLDRATLLRILQTLEDAGWVYRGLGDNCYRITYQIHELGLKVSTNDALAQLAVPVLEKLQGELVWPSDIAIYNGTSMEIVETTRKRTPFIINREIMGARPDMLQSAMGRAYIAFCPDREREAILYRLRNSDTKDGELARKETRVKALLNDIRNKGYAEREAGYWGNVGNYGGQVSAIAVPIMLMDEVQATMNLVWLTGTSDQVQIEEVYLPHLQRAAAEIANLLFDNQLY